MPDIPRSERDFKLQLELMTQNLKECHLKLWRGDVSEASQAFDLILRAIQAHDIQETEDPLEIVKQVLGGQAKDLDDAALATAPISVVIIALTYAYRAFQAREVHRDTELSWSFLTDCCFWTGAAVSGKDLPDINESVRKKLASRGAKAKNEPHATVREFAYQFVRDNGPAEGRWKTVTCAVQGIERALGKTQAADEFEGSSPVVMVEPKTIYNWLAVMPDRDRFLPPKKTRNKL